MKQLITLLSISSLLPCWGQNVNMESTFGNAGVSITPNTSEINCLVTDANGNIFSAGYSIESGGTGIYHLTVTKHSENGTLVSNFGANGVVTTVIDHSEFPLDIQVQTDGKILVAGSSYLGPTPSGPGDYHSFVVRYNTDGTLDASFGNNGVYKLPYPDSHVAKMIVLPDGSVLLAGNSYSNGCISKIDAGGNLDLSFGNLGTRFFSDAGFTFILWDAILLSDNTVLTVGYDGENLSNMKLAYCKTDLTGNYVPGFGQNGKVVTDLFNTLPEVTELLQRAVELPDGKIVIGGQAMNAILLKINPDGSFDTSFGNNGILNHPYPFADFQVQTDGKFLIGGSQEVTDYNAGISVTRLHADGSLDNSFNGTGTFTADVSPGNDYLQTLKLLNGERILIGGSSKLLSSNADFMLASIDISQSLGLSEENCHDISVHPNPFSDEVTISITNTAVTEIRLIDEAGRTINQWVPSLENSLHLGTLTPGVYQLVVSDQSGGIAVKKLVKE